MLEEVLEDYGLWGKYLLALLYAKGKIPISGRLKLQKELFILSKGIKELKTDNVFEAHFLGPYSSMIEEEVVEGLELDDLINVSGKKNVYSLTHEGEKLAEQIFKNLPENERNLLEWVKENFNDLEDDELLALIYFTFEDSAKHSEKIREITKKRRKIAERLYKKERVSIKKAAKIAGMSETEFEKVIRR